MNSMNRTLNGFTRGAQVKASGTLYTFRLKMQSASESNIYTDYSKFRCNQTILSTYKQ